MIMMSPDDKEIAERRVVQRTSHAIAEVTERLRMLGLYGVDIDGDGRCTPVAIRTDDRRELLVFLSEIEDLVRQMESFTTTLASSIAAHDRGRSAVDAYRQAGAAYRKFKRLGKH